MASFIRVTHVDFLIMLRNPAIRLRNAFGCFFLLPLLPIRPSWFGSAASYQQAFSPGGRGMRSALGPGGWQPFAPSCMRTGAGVGISPAAARMGNAASFPWLVLRCLC